MMMRILLLAFVLFLPGCDGGWREISSATMGFRVSMPGQPVSSSYDSTASRWKGESYYLEPGNTWQMSGSPERAFTYRASGELIPGSWSHEAVVDKYFQERLKPTSQQRVVQKKEIVNGDLKGVEIRIIDRGVLHQTRVFVRNDRAFVLEVMAGEKAADSIAIERYFNSLRIVE